MSMFRKKLGQLPQSVQPKHNKNKNLDLVPETNPNRLSDGTCTEKVEWKRSAEAEMIMLMLKKEAEKLDSGIKDERKTIEVASPINHLKIDISNESSPINSPQSARNTISQRKLTPPPIPPKRGDSMSAMDRDLIIRNPTTNIPDNSVTNNDLSTTKVEPIEEDNFLYQKNTFPTPPRELPTSSHKRTLSAETKPPILPKKITGSTNTTRSKTPTIPKRLMKPPLPPRSSSMFSIAKQADKIEKNTKDTEISTKAPGSEIYNTPVVWRKNPEAEKIMMMLQEEAEKDKKSNCTSPTQRRNTLFVDNSYNENNPQEQRVSMFHEVSKSISDQKEDCYKEKKIKKASVSSRIFTKTRSYSLSHKKDVISISRSDVNKGSLDQLGKDFDSFRHKTLSPRGLTEDCNNDTNKDEISNEEIHEIDKRTQIVLEIRASERSYVSVLESLKDNYCGRLLSATKSNQIIDITEAKIKQIFSNVSLILNINQMLYSEIDSRVNNWDETKTIGDIFIDVTPYLKIYDQYGNNYSHSLELLTECKKNPSFSSILEDIECSTDSNLRLESLLIAPIQRLPRYILLLNDLKRKTDESHPDYKLLNEAIPAMQNVADHVNNNIEKAKSKQKFVELSSGGAASLLLAHRNLIYEIEIRCENKKKPTQFYVFNDILVHLSASKAKHKPNLTLPSSQWPLNVIWFDNDSSNNVKIIGPAEENYIVKMGVGNSSNFIKELQTAVNNQLEKEYKKRDPSLTEFPTVYTPKRIGSHLYSNSVVYSGEWYIGKMHGKGLWKFLDHEYEGNFCENKKSGFGTMTYFNGNIYTGNWENDLPHGDGILKYPTGDKYEGEFDSGTINGKGTMTFGNGDTFDGYWKDNKPDGVGTFNYHTGITYSGTFKNGRYHNYGVLSCSKTGMKYEGEWVNGFREGKGRLEYKDGSVYDGYWKQGLKSGTGEYISKSEGTYNGEWLGDLKHGKGTMEFKSQNVYSGEWQHGKFHGNGKVIYASGSIALYDGNWENNMKSGEGMLHYANGDSFEGIFQNDMKNGQGTYTFANGLVISGKWINDNLEGKTRISTLYKLDSPTFTGNLSQNIWTASETLPSLHFHTMPDLIFDSW